MAESGDKSETFEVVANDASHVTTHVHNSSLQISPKKINGRNFLPWSWACLLSIQANNM